MVHADEALVSGGRTMIVGLMAICRFPFYELCLKDLLSRVHKVYLRFDGITGDYGILKKLSGICGAKLGDIFISSSKWNPFIWREELIRMLDSVKPDLVLFPDEDERFEKDIDIDIKRLIKSDKMQMAFNYRYPSPSVDGWKWYKPYPANPHVKMFKWKKGLAYIPYMKRGRLSNYGKFDYKMGKSKILHYCFYTPELRRNKLWNKEQKEQWFLRAVKNELVIS
jgi:hypothetical protein